MSHNSLRVLQRHRFPQIVQKGEILQNLLGGFQGRDSLPLRQGAVSSIYGYRCFPQKLEKPGNLFGRSLQNVCVNLASLLQNVPAPGRDFGIVKIPVSFFQGKPQCIFLLIGIMKNLWPAAKPTYKQAIPVSKHIFQFHTGPDFLRNYPLKTSRENPIQIGQAIPVFCQECNEDGLLRSVQAMELSPINALQFRSSFPENPGKFRKCLHRIEVCYGDGLCSLSQGVVHNFCRCNHPLPMRSKRADIQLYIVFHMPSFGLS